LRGVKKSTPGEGMSGDRPHLRKMRGDPIPRICTKRKQVWGETG